jgi:hypothetical protein
MNQREIRRLRRQTESDPNPSLAASSSATDPNPGDEESTPLPLSKQTARHREKKRDRASKQTPTGREEGRGMGGTGGTTGNIPLDIVLTAEEQADKERHLKEVLGKTVWPKKPLQLPFFPAGTEDGMVRWPLSSRSISTTCGVDALRACNGSLMQTNTARMMDAVPGSAKAGVTPVELVKLVRGDIVLETTSSSSPSCVFDRTLGEGLLILLLERKGTEDYHWCIFLPGVGFWDRPGRGAKPPVEGGVDAWLDTLGYTPVVHHAFTPVVPLWRQNDTTGKLERGRVGYIPSSILQYGKGDKGIHVSVSRLPRAPPTPRTLKLKVGQWGSLNYNGSLLKVGYCT